MATLVARTLAGIVRKGKRIGQMRRKSGKRNMDTTGVIVTEVMITAVEAVQTTRGTEAGSIPMRGGKTTTSRSTGHITFGTGHGTADLVHTIHHMMDERRASRILAAGSAS